MLDLGWVLKIQYVIWIVQYDSPLISAPRILFVLSPQQRKPGDPSGKAGIKV